VEAAARESRQKALDLEAQRQAAEAARKAAEAAAQQTYVVKAGDSLSVIALRELGDAMRWPEIYELNKAVIGDNPNLIQVGAKLVLPKK